MTITRTFCSAGLLALAAIMGPVAPGYAGEPCCDWVYGKYINLKTGKEVKPPKGAVAPGSVESAAREPKGKGRELLQILISRDFETGEPRKPREGFVRDVQSAIKDAGGRLCSIVLILHG